VKFNGPSGEYFESLTVNQVNRAFLKQSKDTELSILWFQQDDNHIKLDGVEYVFNRNDVICTTEFTKIEVVRLNRIKAIRWNRPFYCVLIHDSEVSCRGILFYGATTVPAIHLKEKDYQKLDLVWAVLENELTEADKFQQEMLQMLLKRILILCTRFYKEQEGYQQLGSSVKIVRDYNFLVDQHFREKQSVAEYAGILNISPKSLTNLFKKLGTKTPLQFIQERKIIEAHRLLIYTDKTISDIAYELGFSDVQAFSRFFKNQDGVSPMEYKKQKGKGSIANS